MLWKALIRLWTKFCILNWVEIVNYSRKLFRFMSFNSMKLSNNLLVRIISCKWIIRWAGSLFSIISCDDINRSLQYLLRNIYSKNPMRFFWSSWCFKIQLRALSGSWAFHTWIHNGDLGWKLNPTIDFLLLIEDLFNLQWT